MKARSQILSAIGLVPLALITLPEHWPVFAKVAVWYCALTALLWLIGKGPEWYKARLFERIEARERDERRLSRLNSASLERVQHAIDTLPPADREAWRKCMRSGTGMN